MAHRKPSRHPNKPRTAAEALLRALLDVRRMQTHPPPTTRSAVEDVSPFTLREGLFYEAGE